MFVPVEVSGLGRKILPAVCYCSSYVLGQIPSVPFSPPLVELSSESHSHHTKNRDFSGSCKLNQITDSAQWMRLDLSIFCMLLAFGYKTTGWGGVFKYLWIKTLRWIPLCYWARSSSFFCRENFLFIMGFWLFSIFANLAISRMLENRCLISVALQAFPLFLRKGKFTEAL